MHITAPARQHGKSHLIRSVSTIRRPTAGRFQLFSNDTRIAHRKEHVYPFPPAGQMPHLGANSTYRVSRTWSSCPACCRNRNWKNPNRWLDSYRRNSNFRPSRSGRQFLWSCTIDRRAHPSALAQQAPNPKTASCTKPITAIGKQTVVKKRINFLFRKENTIFSSHHPELFFYIYARI